MELGEPRQLILPPCTQCGENRVVVARQVPKHEMESSPAFIEFLRHQRQVAALRQQYRARQQQLRRQLSQQQQQQQQDSVDGGINGVGGAAAAAFGSSSRTSRY